MSISLRGDELSITGDDPEHFKEAKKVVAALLGLVRKRNYDYTP